MFNFIIKPHIFGYCSFFHGFLVHGLKQKYVKISLVNPPVKVSPVPKQLKTSLVNPKVKNFTYPKYRQIKIFFINPSLKNINCPKQMKISFINPLIKNFTYPKQMKTSLVTPRQMKTSFAPSPFFFSHENFFCENSAWSTKT